ncbi:MAG: bifunctional histidinol-phosphatase/imidazoleglycerol-phosphate dehydratase HisB [Bacteroidetes bacterium]|nr:MAG: bifunctional histidinol-phosphatase/imidazoleglycerol-phosphate dehydratase HisB [Bacteroidota bacterium]
MKKKILFIDRDGTLIVEPKDTFQIDSLEKLEFLPKVIQALSQIQNLHEYLFVMVTNQDGLGTESFPENDFWLPQQKMMQVFENEGIAFHKIHIDRSFEHENLPTRKPNIGMLKEYFSAEYDLANSFVIGDRITDVQLAENLGSKAIIYGEKHDSRAVLRTFDWLEIANFLKTCSRKASIHRKTNETDIRISLDLDSNLKGKIQTGIGFFDHLLDQLTKHSGCFLDIWVIGDLHIDEHHSIEDTALALGEAFLLALGDKRGINRYGHFLLPMDETLAQVAIDFSGRPQLVWQAEFKREKVGDFPTEMFYHFFKSFSDTAKCNLNIKIEGENEHHKIEATFKAFAKAIKMAIFREVGNHEIPSTKGIL